MGFQTRAGWCLVNPSQKQRNLKLSSGFLSGCSIRKNIILISHTVRVKTVLCQPQKDPKEFQLSLSYFDINWKVPFFAPLKSVLILLKSYIALAVRGIACLPSDLQPHSNLLPQRGAGDQYRAWAAENELLTCQDKGFPCIHLCNSWHNTALIKQDY